MPDERPQVAVCHPRLVYDDLDDAAAKIVALLDDPVGQEELGGALVERGAA